MTSTRKPRDPNNRLTRGIVVAAIAAALGGATCGFTTSPGVTGSRPGDGSSSIRSSRVVPVRIASNGGSRADDQPKDILLMRKAGKPQQEYF